MSNSIFQSEIIYMKNVHHLFIEMTAKNCNQHCKYCYIDFPKYRKISDFISIDTIKQALNDTTKEDIQCIYLTGAEPMTHPDFNAVLRLCLQRSNVCICTNGSFINEKKARFLKKVEEESNNEIIFKLSMVHYDEVKNDDVRYRGAFRHSLFALKNLNKYDFTPIITIANFYNLKDKDLYDGFSSVFKRNNLEIDTSHFQITPWYNQNENLEQQNTPKISNLDCSCGRILTATGVYTCPFLANDYRGRCGSSFLDFNKKCAIETDFCATCTKDGRQIFSIDFSKFE
jgi:MoaA/NifB/PqqE/SkfB family radical SAM enzyme